MKIRLISLALCLVTAICLPAQGGDAILSIAVTEATDSEYDDDVNQAIRAGATATSLTVFWDEADKRGKYAPDFDWPAIANSYYPGKKMGLILSLPVIDTVADRRPKDLAKKRWDDEQVITRFESYVGKVLARLADTDLVAISIGNEIDGHLRRDKDWKRYEVFFAAARDAVHRLRPGVPVGFTMTWQGMQGRNAARSAQLNQHTDAVFINYYPLDDGFQVLPPADISHQLDAMIRTAGHKPVFLLETGYPSGGCGSDPARQLAYFQQLMAAWDGRKASIPLVNLVWLHDISKSAVKGYSGYYGTKNQCFQSYLATLGLRSLDGKNKPAFDWLINR